MDKRMEDIYENIKKHRLTPDSVFMFHCTMCGDCCRNRDDILLNSKDLFNLAKGLKIAPKDVVEKYCETYLGASSRMPIVRLKPVGFDKHCAFLERNGCAVQAFKPTVCAMFPIGRFRECGKDKPDEINYMFNDPHCGDKREIHTVRGWLSMYGIPENDEFYLKWTNTVETLTASLSKLEKYLKTDTMEKLWTFVCFFLYLNYDAEKEFMPQFLKNSEIVIGNIKNLEDKKGGVI